MKISARNTLKGTVKAITPGAVNTEVVIQLSGGEQVVSIITKESAENLELAVGKQVYAVSKSSDDGDGGLAPTSRRRQTRRERNGDVDVPPLRRTDRREL